MNDPYNGNGRKSPEDDLGRSIEKEVKETIGTVAAALQDAAREVSTSLRDNESVQRTVKRGGRPDAACGHFGGVRVFCF